MNRINTINKKHMRIGLITLFVFTVQLAGAQSSSFGTLKSKFSGHEEVQSIKVGTFFLKTALLLANESDEEVLQDIRSVRILTVPHRELEAMQLSLNGYIRKVVVPDGFEELMNFREDGTHTRIYQKQRNENSNYYLILNDEESSITAIEIVGNVDVNKLINTRNKTINPVK